MIVLWEDWEDELHLSPLWPLAVLLGAFLPGSGGSLLLPLLGSYLARNGRGTPGEKGVWSKR